MLYKAVQLLCYPQGIKTEKRQIRYSELSMCLDPKGDRSDSVDVIG